MPDKRETPKKGKALRPRHPGRAWAKEMAARFQEALARSTPEERAASVRAAVERWRRAHPEAVEKEREVLLGMGFDEVEAWELAAASAYCGWTKETAAIMDLLRAELRERSGGRQQRHSQAPGEATKAKRRRNRSSPRSRRRRADE